MRLLLGIALLLFTLVSSVHADLDRTGRRPPHYAGKPPAQPVRAVRGPLLTGRSFMDPGPSASALEALAEVRPEVEALLDSLVGPIAQALTDGSAAGAPAVYVGAVGGFYAPPRADGDDDVATPRDAVWIHAQDAGGPWRRRARAAADSAGATHVIVVALELSDYPVSQKNWKGAKAVDLAAGHTIGVPWLTSLDQPAEVLQWTGALMSRRRTTGPRRGRGVPRATDAVRPGGARRAAIHHRGGPACGTRRVT